MPTATPPAVIIRDNDRRCWLRFTNPLEVLAAHTPAEVMPALRRIETEVSDGLHVAGFLSYEAAPAFDTALTVREDNSGFPLMWFGLFEAPEVLDALPHPAGAAGPELDWRSEVTDEEYRRALTRIKEYIAAGDTYQVNFTYRLHAPFPADPFDAFLSLAHTQRPKYAAYIDTGEWTAVSASPELFFHREGALIESRPMKGTAARGLWFEHDADIGKLLAASHKNRAENVMIVDMVRNDLGRIASWGSITVPRLFQVQRHPTVWQMTSTVLAETTFPFGETFRALFPPASITGAPRARTMEIIAELESTPRRIYTGAIGFVSPAGRDSCSASRAQFNVAIRTLLVDRRAGIAEYGTGGGIVWDSDIDGEQRECLAKTRILRPSPRFDLLETIRWEPCAGYRLLRRHLVRLSRSANYFAFEYEAGAVHRKLREVAADLPSDPHRVRVLVSNSGAVRVETQPVDPAWRPPKTVALARGSVRSDDRFLYHKTTHRAVYEAALAAWPEHDEVLLANERGEITETTVANVAVEIDGRLFTPPVSSGLLPGTYREWLLDIGRLHVREITMDDLGSAGTVWLFNSVRGMYPVAVDA